MKKSQFFNRLVKSKGARLLTAFAVFLLVMQPYAFALDQVVNKYVSDYYVQTQDVGNSHLLDLGSVFNFNNAKAPTVDYNAAILSEVDESNCDPESTIFTFEGGSDGFEGTPDPLVLELKYLYDAANYAIEASVTKKNKNPTFVYERKFFYECGTSGLPSDFKIRYRVPYATGISTTGTGNYFKVDLIKPSGAIVPLIAQTNFTTTVPWTWLPGPADTNTFSIATNNWTESGVYKIKIYGYLKTSTSGSGQKVGVQFDDITLRKASLWSDYRHDVEYKIKAAPFSQLGGLPALGYRLEISAARKTSTADNVDVLVYNGAAWNLKGTITQVYNDTLPQNNLQALSIDLTDAEYNNGLVRVRYVDATQSGDAMPGGLYIDYQRIRVDQGACVQTVESNEADCGKCHNYNGDITKPWPNVGMHDKHAQTESIADCAWCHPDYSATTPSDHMDGTLQIDGTKIFKLGGSSSHGLTNQTYNSATGLCANSNCHNNITTPSWTATYGATQGELNGTTVIARNCARCHNNGVNPGDNVSDLNVASSWPNTLAHAEHDSAFNLTQDSCQANGSCHPNNIGQHTVTGDLAGVVTKMSPKYQSPSGGTLKYLKATTALGDGRCYNASCHGGQETPKWDITLPDSGGSLDPSQPNSAYCKACHKGEKATTWTPGAVSPDISAKQFNSPISGLHQGSPPTSGKSHVSEYGCAVCHNNANLTLHFKSAGGVTNLDTPGMDLGALGIVGTMGYVRDGSTGTAPSYSDGSPPTCATPNPGPTGVACHAETSLDSALPPGKLAPHNTPWNRDWSWDSYSSTPSDQCKVCHGVYGSFKNLRPDHITNPATSQPILLAGNHSDNGIYCGVMCHGTGLGGPDAGQPSPPGGGNVWNHGVSMTADAKTIDVNDTGAGFAQTTGTEETTQTTLGTYSQQYYQQTTPTGNVGCTGCHDNGVGTPRFSMLESGWALRNQMTGGPAPTCANDTAGCHGNGAADQYWPDGSTYPDKAGEHQVHIQKLAAKLGLGAGPYADLDQKRMCKYCHADTPGAGGHSTDSAPTGVADVSGINPITSTADPPTGDAGTAAAFNTTTGSCAGVDCHNNKDSTATYGWWAAAASTCTMCHTVGGATNDPTSGLHNVTPSVSGKKHDDTIAGGCTACHYNMPATVTTNHLNGTFTGDTVGDMGLRYYTQSAANTGTCVSTTCHLGGASGSDDWAHKWMATANYTSSTAACAGCHSDWTNNGTTWNAGVIHRTTAGTPTQHGGTGTYDCKDCHTLEATANNYTFTFGTTDWNPLNSTSEHGNGSIEINTNASYNDTSGLCSSACHNSSDGIHNFLDSAWPIVTLAGDAINAGGCDSCHKPGGSGPTVVYPTGTGAPAGSMTVYGSHMKVTRAETLSGSTNWDTQCRKCHPYHTGGVTIPNKTGFFNYATNGGLHLGGTSTSGTTEAEICWNCHKLAGSPIPSEFGTNTNGTYNYGSLHTTSGDATASPGNEVNWVTGYWKSALFSYKNGPLANRPTRTGADPGTVDGGSIHATGGTPGTQSETLASVRCSYCHDVHDTQGTGAGKPLLRGSWRTNPYKEDGAPKSGVTFSISLYGPVPRGSTSTTGNGGYQIDQNNANPNSSYAYATSDGLCNLCHTQAAIQTAWVGHNNSVRGFTNDTSATRNIFKTSIRGTQNNRTVRPHMAYQGVTAYISSNYMGGLRASDTNTTASLAAPRVNGKIYGYQSANFPWTGVSVDDTTVNADYHSFSCSKCHTPHASRLPRLMITNCLDTRLNTWDDQFTSDANWANWTMTNLTDATAKKNLAYASTAQNCHRRIDANADGDTADVGEEPGWNTVTPW